MQSETISALAAALAKAQGAIKPAPMDRDNPFFKSKYATLTSLWESARAALSANGLSVVQTTDFSESGDLVLISTLMHSSGEWVGSAYPVRAKDGTPQALGSALTYARRYAFGALVGLTSDDDDDGNAANGTNSAHPQTRKEAPPQSNPAPAATVTTTGNGGGAGNGHAAKASDGALKAFHAVGARLYGQNWDAKRHEIVRAATKGRTESSRELTPTEIKFLVERMDAKLQEQLEAANVQDAPEIDPDAAEIPA